MNGTDVLADAFGRIRETVREVVGGLSADELNERLDGTTNSITWLVWHLTRIQDDHIADASGLEQVWTAKGWAACLDLPLPSHSTGYGHSGRQVAAVRVDSPDLLLGYHEAVHEQTLAFLGTLDDAALDRVVDESWDPPVTLGVRLVSVVGDDLQHIGQAALLRGVLEHRS
ncbi:mycothiol transferase [Peterkaempfera bronchialis]|uniref:DUF664 domain-containing protein n=1 Tax=Peterkaempfera bronchialis TaxID=2126346 RepID=A0A345SRA4_9ACTN|nr:DUF664 domain-containing protein [Peterkaempfera bronchialis]AXI76259.1 DUF664 domain-containing protein [Peterkaempfera bronchialis]